MTSGTVTYTYKWCPSAQRLCTMTQPIRFDSPTEAQFRNTIKPRRIVEFFYDRYPDCKNLQSSSHCRKVLDFSCETRYFSLRRCCKNSLLRLDWLLKPYRSCLTFPWRIPSIYGRILMLIGSCVVIHKPYLKFQIKNTQVKWQVGFFLDIFGIHSGLCPDQEFFEIALFRNVRSQGNRRCIPRTRT